MRYSSSLVFAGLAALVATSPIGKRAATKASKTDILVLTFADVLEQLETQFYGNALSKFKASDFSAAGFKDPELPVEQFKVIHNDEATHARVLEDALVSFGAKPLTTCRFNFDSALKDVPTMAATARLVENLGVSAYLGAAHLISDPVILTAAGSILTVEARHQTVLNILSGGGSAIPQAFDIALLPNEVLAIASPFISGCDLGVPANPTLSITNTDTVKAGTTLTFASDALKGKSTGGFGCQMLIGGMPFALALPFDKCVVSPGINGPVAVFITKDQKPLSGNVRDRGVDQILAGPTMAFIDATNEKLDAVARDASQTTSTSTTSASTTTSSTSTSTTSTSASTSSSTTTTSTSTSTASGSATTSRSTTTISPQSASSILASATSTAAPTPTVQVALTNGHNADFANNVTGTTQSGNIDVQGWTFPQ